MKAPTDSRGRGCSGTCSSPQRPPGGGRATGGGLIHRVVTWNQSSPSGELEPVRGNTNRGQRGSFREEETRSEFLLHHFFCWRCFHHWHRLEMEVKTSGEFIEQSSGCIDPLAVALTSLWPLTLGERFNNPFYSATNCHLNTISDHRKVPLVHRWSLLFTQQKNQ